MENGQPFAKTVVASMKEAFKEELIHFAECVRHGKTPITTPEEARGDVALLHKIFHAIKRPLA
jgi:predicted dehydrogenase